MGSPRLQVMVVRETGSFCPFDVTCYSDCDRPPRGGRGLETHEEIGKPTFAVNSSGDIAPRAGGAD